MKVLDIPHLDHQLNLRFQTEAIQLETLLNLKFGREIRDILPQVILHPIHDLIGRPGKKIRGRLVQLGYDMAVSVSTNGNAEGVEKLSQAVEFLHAGSLAIDDIQDGSKLRRGRATLHLKFGLPLALNTGNWLYFWPLEMIRSWKLDPKMELDLYHIFHRTMVRAHVGQAIDVGVSVLQLPQEKVYDVCLASLELKSGALFSLALVSGAILGGADQKLIENLDEFGHGFGMALQMFDDVGNLKGKVDTCKKWEDLFLKRPTWVWACAARYFEDTVFEQFIAAVRELPHDKRLEKWIEHNDFYDKSLFYAKQHLTQCKRKLKQDNFIQKIERLEKEIMNAYI